MRVVGAILLWTCACVGALQLDEPESSVLQFWSLAGAHNLNRRGAPADSVAVDKPGANGTAANITVSTTAVPAANATDAAEDPVKKIDLTKPGVLKRGLLVFGGFGLLAVAYFVFYKRRRNRSEGDGSNNQSEGAQFRYGVLQTDDRSDRMELSHLPLTMDSDDDEEDLEIFDLGQKKPYVSLHSDEHQSVVQDILASSAGGARESEHLLLDIDDRNSPAVIPLSSVKDSDII